MSLNNTEGIIRDFLINDLLYDRSFKDLGLDEPLIDSGILDSLAIMRTVSFCEETFGVTIPDEEVLPEHFENIRAIAKLVERRFART